MAGQGWKPDLQLHAGKLQVYLLLNKPCGPDTAARGSGKWHFAGQASATGQTQEALASSLVQVFCRIVCMWRSCFDNFKLNFPKKGSAEMDVMILSNFGWTNQANSGKQTQVIK